MDVEAVAKAIRFAEKEEIAPRFRNLVSGDIENKSHGEVVTSADRACEQVLSSLLRNVSDVPVVGEEAAHADSSLLELVGSRPAVWLLDPLDGTSNFAKGIPRYSVMVAYVEAGLTVSSWMWNPTTQQMSIASRGGGAEINGIAIDAEATAKPISLSVGVVKTRFMPEPVGSTVAATERHFGSFVAGANCAGVDYPALASGKTADFLVYWRTFPWDHAPGTLFAEEAGFAAMRPDGSEYRCGDSKTGLIVAHRNSCDEIRRWLFDSLIG